MALRARLATFAVLVTLSLSALLLVPRLGMELIPRMAQQEFYVDINLPAGSRLDTTDATLNQIANYAQTLDAVERTYSLAGTGSLVSASPEQGGDHWGKINIVLRESVDKAAVANTQEQLRQYVARLPGVTAKIAYPELFSFAAPIQIEVSGYDLDTLQSQGQIIAASLADNDRFTDISTTLRPGNPELSISFNHALLNQLGLNAATVSQVIATKIGGDVATQYSIEDRRVDVLVLTNERQRDTLADIGNIIINSNAVEPIPLSAVAELRMDIGPSEITRVGQQRVAVVTANLAYGDVQQGVVATQAILSEHTLPVGFTARIAGQSEDMQASFTSLQFALALAVFLVYLVMACQFESLFQPLLILIAVPLAGAGSIYGLWLTGTNVSVVVFIGLIMLAGIVVNNAIVLIDRINQLRSEGIAKTDAIHQAALQRLRPIVMTTLTTILGLLPMALGLGEGAEVRTPMAITVIFGLMFSSMLTLILLPIMYSLFERKNFTKLQSRNATNTATGEHVYG